MSFIRSSLVLVSGTVVAHGITAAALPILSRIYTPTDFSTLAVFTSLVSLISVCACLRFDVAIALPEKDSDAVVLLILSLTLAALISLAILLIVGIFPSYIANTLGQPQLEKFLLLLPLAILFASSYNALLTWFIREKGFTTISKSRVAQSAGAAGIQISTGLLGFLPSGLLFGYSINAGIASFIFLFTILKNRILRTMFKAVSWTSMKSTFKAYDRYPKYSTWEALCNTGSMQLPVLLIASLAAPQESGYLMMATFVLQAPTALIGSSIGQVYLSQATEKYREGNLEQFTKNIVFGLTKTGLPTLAILGILSPLTFGMIFGSQWDRAGLLILWMTPWFIMQFITVPVSMSLHITNNQKTAVWIQLFGLLFRLATVWLASIIAHDKIVESYALSGAIFYAVYLYIVIKKIQHATSASI